MAETSQRYSSGILEVAQHQQKMEIGKLKMIDKCLARNCLDNNQSIKLEKVHTATEGNSESIEEIVLADSDDEESMEAIPVQEQPDIEDQSVFFNVPWEPGNKIAIPLATMMNLGPGRSILIGELGHLLVKTKKGEYKISRIEPESQDQSDTVTKLEGNQKTTINQFKTTQKALFRF